MRNPGRLTAVAWLAAGGLWWLSSHPFFAEAAAGSVNGALLRAVAGLTAAAWLASWWVGPLIRRVVLVAAALGGATPLVVAISAADGFPGTLALAVGLTVVSAATCVLGATVVSWPVRTARASEGTLDEVALWHAQSRGEDPTATPPGLD